MILGYPPADHQVRDFLTEKGTQLQVYEHICAFLTALFKRTTEVVNAEKNIKGIAGKFRDKMT